MIPNPIPKGTTREQWERYELEKKNHETHIQNQKDFLQAVLSSVDEHGMEKTFRMFNDDLNKSLSMDAPNEPGYYRANND